MLYLSLIHISLTAFIEAFREEGRTVRTMTEAVVRLLEALSVEEKMLAREASLDVYKRQPE